MSYYGSGDYLNVKPKRVIPQRPPLKQQPVRIPVNQPEVRRPIPKQPVEQAPLRRPLMPFANLRPLQKPTQIYAKHGWHGFVDHPTNFIVGEAGKERVDIYPTKKKKRGMSDFDFGKAGSDLGDFDFAGGYI